MAKKARKRISINLSSLGKQTVSRVVYGWMIDAGRAIIIGIELIALSALGYRFMVDSKIIDLNDQISRKERDISSFSGSEKRFRSIHARLEIIKSIQNETNNKISIMNEILREISDGTFYSTSLSINKDTINIEGNTFTTSNLNTFLIELKKQSSVASISIDEIGRGSTGIQFKVTINLKNIISKNIEGNI